MDAEGHLAQSPRTGLGLLISGTEVDDASSQYFGLVALTLENQSSDWVRITRMDLTFGGGTKDASVVIPRGDDVAAWEEATQQRNAVRSANTEAVLGTLALGAAIAAAATSHKPQAALGAAAEVGAIGLLVAHNVAEDHARAGAIYPESHLLAMPLSIPPGLFAKRWILLSTPPGIKPDCVTSMLLTYQTESGQAERVWLHFRRVTGDSEWQRDACEHAWHR